MTAGSWIAAHLLDAVLQWARGLELAGGSYIRRDLRLVRPVMDAGAQLTWVADHFARRHQVAITFAASCLEPGAPSKPRRLRAKSAAIREAAARDAAFFARHAQLTAQLSDRRLVGVLEQGEIQGVPFLMTELVEGSLRQRLVHQGPLTRAEAHAFAQQAGAVLARAHALPCAHGSIRPEHLFLTNTPEGPFLRVSRLGCGSAAGYPSPSLLEHAYDSPEWLLSGGAAHTPADDLWALSVTLYELLTTTLPFEAPTAAGVAVAITSGQFALPSHYRADLPSAVDAWFQRALSKNPRERFHDALELTRSFELALGGEQRSDLGPGGLADADLSDEDDDEDERTVKWDLPADWALSGAASAAGAPPSGMSPAATSRAGLSMGAPSIGAPSIGDVASASGPPPLPDRPPSSRPPPVDPSPMTGVYTADLARLARLPPPPGGLAAPAFPEEPPGVGEPPHAGLRFGVAGRALSFGAGLGAASALALWLVQGFAGNGATDDVTAELEVSAAGRAEESMLKAEELPRIIRSDDLPAAQEEGEPDRVAQRAPQPEAHAPPEPAAAVAPEPTPEPARARARSGPKGNFTYASGRAAPVRAPARPRPRPQPPAPKRAKADSSCNPPYYFDSNNIRRLKLECL